jgi:hypothetical protein
MRYYPVNITMAFNELVLNDITRYINDTPAFTKKDLVSYVGKVFDEHKTTVPRKKLLKLGKKDKKENDEENDKPKRQPTAYQLFVKTTLPELKAREDAKDDGEVRLKQTELIREVAKMWKEQQVPKDELLTVKHDSPPSSPVRLNAEKARRGKKGGKKTEVIDDSD